MERDRGEIAKSSFSGSGSDQTRSAIGPSCGISERDDDGEIGDRDGKDANLGIDQLP